MPLLFPIWAFGWYPSAHPTYCPCCWLGFQFPFGSPWSAPPKELSFSSSPLSCPPTFCEFFLCNPTWHLQSICRNLWFCSQPWTVWSEQISSLFMTLSILPKATGFAWCISVFHHGYVHLPQLSDPSSSFRPLLWHSAIPENGPSSPWTVPPSLTTSFSSSPAGAIFWDRPWLFWHWPLNFGQWRGVPFTFISITSSSALSTFLFWYLRPLLLWFWGQALHWGSWFCPTITFLVCLFCWSTDLHSLLLCSRVAPFWRCFIGFVPPELLSLPLVYSPLFDAALPLLLFIFGVAQSIVPFFMTPPWLWSPAFAPWFKATARTFSVCTFTPPSPCTSSSLPLTPHLSRTDGRWASMNPLDFFVAFLLNSLSTHLSSL